MTIERAPLGDLLEAALAELADRIKAECRAECLEAVEAAQAGERLLSIDEAARSLGIGRSALYREIAAGGIRTVKLGRRHLVSTLALREFIEAHST